MPTKKVKRKSSKGQSIETRKVSQLHPYPRQQELFGDPSPEAVTSLARSIEADGLMHPLEILPDGTVVAGHTRLAAVKQLGWKEVPCVVLHDLAAEDEDAIMRYVVRDNIERRQMSKLQLARVRLMMEGHTLERIARFGLSSEDRERIGAILGMTGRNLSRWIRVLGLPTAIQDAVDRKEITLQQAGAITYRPDEEIQAIAKAIRQHKPLAEVFERISIARNIDDDQTTKAFRQFEANLARAVDQLQGRARQVSSYSICKRLPTLEAAHKLLGELIEYASWDPLAALSAVPVPSQKKPKRRAK